MTRIIALCLMLFATPAWAAGAWSPGSIPAGSCSTFTWTSTDAGDAQPPLLVLAGELAITAEVTSGTPSVAFYLIKGANGSDTPASTGTLAYTATATSRSPTYISTGGGYVLDPDIDTAGAAGGTVTVCSAGYANVGRSGLSGLIASAELSTFDAIVNLDTGVTRLATGATNFYTNRCLQLQEAINPYLDTSTGTYQRRAIHVVGDLTASVATDFHDTGLGHSICFGLIPTSSTPGTGGSGGYSTDDTARTGWPELINRVIATGFNGRTATAGGATTITDSDGATLASQGGKYVRITANTGSGQTRYIASATSTTLTVDTAWSVNPDATSVFDVFTIPSRSGGGTEYTIFWDQVSATINQAGATQPWVFIQRGNAWASGSANASEGSASQLSNGHEYGSLSVQVSGTETVSTGWIAGRIPEMATAAIVNADHAGIIEFDNGALRIEKNTRYILSGSPGGTGTPSLQNVGLLTFDTWGSNRTSCGLYGGFGVARVLLGNNYSFYDGCYVAGNLVNDVWGTGALGGQHTYYSSCTSGYCTSPVVGGLAHGPTMRRNLLETGPWGQILAFDTGNESGYVDLHIEDGAVLNDQIIMGAGLCNATDATTVGRGCASDTSCGSGLCAANGGTSQSNSMFFNGGSLGAYSPAAADPNWRQFVLGRNFTENTGKVVLSGGVAPPLTTVPANSTGTLPCTGAGAPYFYCTAANANPAVTLLFALPTVETGIDAMLEFGDVAASGSALVWPYTYVASQKEFTLAEWTLDTDGTVNPAVGNCMPKGPNLSNIVTGALYENPVTTCTAATAQTWAVPFHVVGNALTSGLGPVYLKDLVCGSGAYVDAGESTSWQARLTNVQSDTDGLANVGNVVALTEGTTAAGAANANAIGINTGLFNCSDDSDVSGTAECNSIGTSNNGMLGLVLQAETQGASGTNSVKVTCKVRGFLTPGTD